MIVFKDITPALKKYSEELLGKTCLEANEILHTKIFKTKQTNCMLVEMQKGKQKYIETYTKQTNYSALFSSKYWSTLDDSRRAILMQWELEKIFGYFEIKVPYLLFLTKNHNPKISYISPSSDVMYLETEHIFASKSAYRALNSLYHEAYHYVDEHLYNIAMEDPKGSNCENHYLMYNVENYFDSDFLKSYYFNEKEESLIKALNSVIYTCQPYEKNANTFALKMNKSLYRKHIECGLMNELDSEEYRRIQEDFEKYYKVLAPKYLGENVEETVTFALDFVAHGHKEEIMDFVYPKERTNISEFSKAPIRNGQNYRQYFTNFFKNFAIHFNNPPKPNKDFYGKMYFIEDEKANNCLDKVVNCEDYFISM